MCGCRHGLVGTGKLGSLGQPVAPCGNLCLDMETDWMPLKKRLETPMPGSLRLRCPDAMMAG